MDTLPLSFCETETSILQDWAQKGYFHSTVLFKIPFVYINFIILARLYLVIVVFQQETVQIYNSIVALQYSYACRTFCCITFILFARL